MWESCALTITFNGDAPCSLAFRYVFTNSLSAAQGGAMSLGLSQKQLGRQQEAEAADYSSGHAGHAAAREPAAAATVAAIAAEEDEVRAFVQQTASAEQARELFPTVLFSFFKMCDNFWHLYPRDPRNQYTAA